MQLRNVVFIHKSGKWYACSFCASRSIPLSQHVGSVCYSQKVVEEWDMSVPSPMSDLRNQYEKGMVSLCGLFSTTKKEASVSTFKHIQGEVNSEKTGPPLLWLFWFSCSEE